MAAVREGAVRPGGTLGVLIGLHADQDAWDVIWTDLHRFQQLSADWAWDNLPPRRLWALIEALPQESAWQRRRNGGSTLLEENVATLLDFLVDGALRDYRSATFDPDKYDEHKALAIAAKRNTQTPPDLPTVIPVALRPDGWSLTADLTRLPEPVVEEVHGHEAHERLLALLT